MRIIFDFDDTIALTKENALKYYRMKTNDYSTSLDDYVENGEKSYHNLMPLFSPIEIQNIFSQEDFYSTLQLYNNAVKVLKELKAQGHTLIICSGQREDGIIYKEHFIKTFLPMIDTIIYMTDISLTKNKIVGDIFVDNELRHIENNSSPHKIHFGKDVKTWDELYRVINYITLENKSS